MRSLVRGAILVVLDLEAARRPWCLSIAMQCTANEAPERRSVRRAPSYRIGTIAVTGSLEKIQRGRTIQGASLNAFEIHRCCRRDFFALYRLVWAAVVLWLSAECWPLGRTPGSCRRAHLPKLCRVVAPGSRSDGCAPHLRCRLAESPSSSPYSSPAHLVLLGKQRAPKGFRGGAPSAASPARMDAHPALPHLRTARGFLFRGESKPKGDR